MNYDMFNQLNVHESKKDPLISIVIPVYNVIPYIREALDSVVNQSYKNLEIIVIDVFESLIHYRENTLDIERQNRLQKG